MNSRDIFEVEIDRGEAHVGDFVDALQAVHDQLADFAGLALALRRVDHKAFGVVDDLLQLAHGDRPLLAGAQQAVEDFLALEFLAPAVFLHHHVGNFVDALVGGEALLALQALAAAADGFAFLALARIDHLVVFKAAKRTLHGRESGRKARNSIVTGENFTTEAPRTRSYGKS